MAGSPNLVFVFADQLRARSLGCYGDTLAITPNIDKFADQSLKFTQAVANSPVCTAYRATLMTGKYTTSHGMVINELRMNPDQRCFGHVLTDAGCATGYIGKWHLYANELGRHREPHNSFVPPGPHRLGFDGEWKAYNFNHLNFSPDAFWHGDTPEPQFYADGLYESDAQTDFAVDFIRRHAGGEDAVPFALFLSWGPPHDPWGRDNVPDRFWRMFENEEFPNPPNYNAANDEPYCDDWARLTDGDREQFQEWRRGYYAQTTSIDHAFGRLIAAIEGADIARDTIVIFTSDHGEMFGAHGRRAKNIFYEEACHVPLLIRWPDRIPARISDACISAVDLMPTILGLMGLEVPDESDGTDLADYMLGKTSTAPKDAFLQICGATAVWEDGHEWRALRDQRYTYAVYRLDGKELLFDRSTDPYQLRNLLHDPEHRNARDDMRRRLKARMARIGDDFDASTHYRDHWTDGNRNIVRSATRTFAPHPQEA